MNHSALAPPPFPVVHTATRQLLLLLQALRNIDRASIAALAAAALSVMWVMARAAAGAALLQASNGWVLLGAAACLMVFAGLRKLRQAFYFTDYVHAEKH